MIELFVINSLWIWGLYSASQVEFIHDEQPEMGVHNDTKELLWFLRYQSVKRFGWFYSKPIIVCPSCMASLHSTYFYLPYLFLTGFTWVGLLMWIPYVVCLSGFNYLIGKIAHK
jgi:hypothetical protein